MENRTGVTITRGEFISNHLKANGINSFNDFVEHMRQIEEHFWGTRFKVYGKWKEKWYAEYLRNGYMDSYTGFRFRGEMRRNEGNKLSSTRSRLSLSIVVFYPVR